MATNLKVNIVEIGLLIYIYLVNFGPVTPQFKRLNAYTLVFVVQILTPQSQDLLDGFLPCLPYDRYLIVD